MNPVIQFKRSTPLSLFGLALFCFAPAPLAQAVVPVPDGGYPGGNTAEGQSALLSLTTGTYNTAVGLFALLSNTSSGLNTAVGAGALLANTSTSGNTAVGAGALLNSTGFQNTATGAFALFNNIAGGFNTAVGHGALSGNISGSGNTALGTGAGNNATGDFNVYVGAGMNGVPGESNTTYIRNIYDSVAVTRQVYVNSDNKIGTLSSSRRYKEEIKAMVKASESLFALKPVTFRYKKEIDRARALSFGLIAEEVGEVSPDLITRDKDGKPETVRYEAINAMLLNEFLKEHRTVQEQSRKLENQETRIQQQDAAIAQLKEEMETLVARIKE